MSSRKVLIRNLEDSRGARSVYVGGVQIEPGREAEIDVSRGFTIGPRPYGGEDPNEPRTGHGFPDNAAAKAAHDAANEAQRAIAAAQLAGKEAQGGNVNPLTREELEQRSIAELRELGQPHGINGRSKAEIVDRLLAHQAGA